MQPSNRRTAAALVIAAGFLCLVAVGCSAPRAPGNIAGPTPTEPPRPGPTEPRRPGPTEPSRPTPQRGPTCPQGFGAAQWPPEIVHQRWGTEFRSFAEVRTTRQRPIEVCGAREQHAYLRRLACPYGPVVFRRAGNIGRGGRCGTIIDLYLVTCGGETKNVQMDLYACPRGRSPFSF